MPTNTNGLVLIKPGTVTPKNDLHSKKVMLSVGWDVKGIIYWKLLSDGCTVTADLYCQQLDRVAQNLKGKKNLVYFLHDNARPHVAKPTREKLLELGWVTIPHPPCSPDLTPADYHLFGSLSNQLREKKFDDKGNPKMDLATFFCQKRLDFDEHGIFFLPERWRQVVNSNGAYIIEN